jgi:hypothetical protein
MINDSDNSRDEAHDMSDDRLDQLLGLATPSVERKRQKRIRKRTVNLLRSTRSGWSSLVSTRSFGLLAAACCIFILFRVSSEIRTHDRTLTVARANDHLSNSTGSTSAGNGSHTKIATHEAAAPKARKTATSHPPIFSKVASKRPKLKRTRSDRRIIGEDSLNELFSANLLRLANSPAGIFAVDQFSRTLDRAIDDHSKELSKSTSPAHRRLARTGQASLGNAGTYRKGQTLIRSSRSRSSRTKSEIASHAKQLKALLAFRQRIEQSLIDQLDNPSETVAATSFRLLCHCGSRPTLSTILDKWNQAPLRRDIAHAAKRLADPRVLGQLALATDSRELQAELMSGLLCQQNSNGLDLFLELTAKHELYGVAQTSGLIANSTKHCLPTERLLDRLRSNRLAIARAAAITLSEINDPRIHNHLLRLAQRPESTHTAVMALTARRDSSSVNFVAMAASDQRWSATVDNAKRKWSRLLAVN